MDPKFIESYETAFSMENQRILFEMLNEKGWPVLQSKDGSLPLTMSFLLARDAKQRLQNALKELTDNKPSREECKKYVLDYLNAANPTVAGECGIDLKCTPLLSTSPAGAVSGSNSIQWGIKIDYDPKNEADFRDTYGSHVTYKDNGTCYISWEDSESKPSIGIYREYYTFAENCYRVQQNLNYEKETLENNIGQEIHLNPISYSFNLICQRRGDFTHRRETNLKPGSDDLMISNDGKLSDVADKAYEEMGDWVNGSYGKMIEALNEIDQ